LLQTRCLVNGKPLDAEMIEAVKEFHELVS